MPISLRLPADIEDRLSNLALKTGRTKTFYATQAICEQIDDLEDIYLAKKRNEKDSLRQRRNDTSIRTYERVWPGALRSPHLPSANLFFFKHSPSPHRQQP
ncbi:MAG: type II toxin-antitoxin system RelB family antitoxin [Burkholderiaceae bacterium]